MPSATNPSWPDRATLRTLLMIAAVIMAAWALYDHLIAQILLDTADAGSLANRLGVHLLLATPVIFYIGGLWQLARFLGDGPAAAERLAAVRRAFLYGALTEIVIVPTLLRWIAHQGGFDLSVSSAAVVVAALALALPFLAASTRTP